MSRSQPWIIRWGWAVVCFCLAIVLWLIPGSAFAQTPQADLPPTDARMETSLNQPRSGDRQAAHDFYRSSDPEPTTALQTEALSEGSQRSATVATLIDRLNEAEQAVSTDSLQQLPGIVTRVQETWAEVEGTIASKSSGDYDRIETLISDLRSTSQKVQPEPDSLRFQIETLKQLLLPYRDSPASYGVWDAMVILLREGIEALLVIVALLAFLNKSGNADKRGWIWVGAGTGILASIATAIVIRLFFSAVFTAANQEVIEGITGVIAAMVLIYVSYWLHSRSSASEWKGYIQKQVAAALQQNGAFSLAFLAFLAIYREGAETVLFYIGIAPSIQTSDLMLGLGLALVLLAALASVMFGLGVRLPLRPFFLVTSLLIYFLGFKFLGNGFHALQVAGILPNHPLGSWPALGGLGLYPTWETVAVQGILVLVAVWVFLLNRISHSPAQASK